MRVHEKLRIALGELGWTQARLAKVADMPQQSVSELLRGKKRLIPLTAVKLGAALGLEPMDLLKQQVEWELNDFEAEYRWLAADVRARRARLNE